MKKIILAIILLVAVKYTYAQTEPQYLYKLGVIDSVFSKNFNESRKIFVQFPDSYKENSDIKYPVVYILDGEVLLPTVYNVQSFYSGGYTPEMILIGISNSKNRTRDLTPTKIKTKYGMPFNEENGQATNFYKFIEEELIPYVENKYPVTNYRTLIGHSYGGLFTIYTLINHPQLFENYLAIDPSLDWDDQALLKQAKEILAENSFKGKSLYMSLSGQLHMQNPDITINNVMKDTTDFTLFARSNISFSNIVNKNKKNDLYFNWEFYPKDIHGTIALPSIKSGLIAAFEWFQMEKTDKFNSPDTPKEELYSIVKYRANKLKNHFRYDVPPYPEELINMSGYMSMDMGQLEKAKMFFELGIEYYPKSPNVYDSMADYYISQKDNNKALKYITKAYEISGNDYFAKRIKTLKN